MKISIVIKHTMFSRSLLASLRFFKNSPFCYFSLETFIRSFFTKPVRHNSEIYIIKIFKKKKLMKKFLLNHVKNFKLFFQQYILKQFKILI